MFKKIKDSYNFSVPVLSLTIFLKFSLDIFYDIFYGESFGDSISFERTMLLTLFICMGIHIYKNMENHPEQGGFSSYVLFTQILKTDKQMKFQKWKFNCFWLQGRSKLLNSTIKINYTVKKLKKKTVKKKKQEYN